MRRSPLNGVGNDYDAFAAEERVVEVSADEQVGRQNAESYQRRGWDSNPRTALRRSAVFKTAPFDRSGTPPSGSR